MKKKKLNIEYHTYENPVLIEGEIERLSLLSELTIKEDSGAIRSIIEQHQKGPKSSIYISIEFDLIGFFELKPTLFDSRIVRKKFQGQSRTQIKQLLLDRIHAVNKVVTKLPEKIYEMITIRIAFEDRIVDVTEIRRKHWEYILYQSNNYKDEYFVSIVFSQSFVDYSKILKLTDQESWMVNNSDGDVIDEMISKKKEENNP